MINFDKLQEIAAQRVAEGKLLSAKYEGVRLIISSGPEGLYTEPALPKEQVLELDSMFDSLHRLAELEKQELLNLRVKEMYHSSVMDVLIDYPEKMDALQSLIDRWLF